MAGDTARYEEVVVVWCGLLQNAENFFAVPAFVIYLSDAFEFFFYRSGLQQAGGNFGIAGKHDDDGL
ncbi:hypothetical protein SAMN02927921_02519 [Sinomicrobium oceani]|uniref:Uncharacterized protein n=1 Tax=Sinomicrobium oceani TaxID=1150368 RepID=A0A1K1QFV1_9FLAO|nr:hypothetical protein SAMN02927921_02519 [Sinomicrobium oceani]